MKKRRRITSVQHQVPSKGRLMLFRFSAAVFVPLLLLAGTELVLRIAGYGYRTSFFEKQKIGTESFLVNNNEFSRRFFPPQLLRHPVAFRMDSEKKPRTFRIFILGESAAMGDPDPLFSAARYMEMLLRERYPEVEFEVVNTAFTAINSHVILPISRACARQDGDFWVVYMGNNEMVGPFGAATVFGRQAPPRAYVNAVLAIRRTRLGQLLTALGRLSGKADSESDFWKGMTMFLENRIAPDAPARQVVYRSFAANLEEILQAGINAEAGIILNTVAVNLKDCPPFATLPGQSLGPDEAARLTSLLEEAKQQQLIGDSRRAVSTHREAVGLAPYNASEHYQLGRLLLENPQSSGTDSSAKVTALEEAARHLQRACDYDALPFRTDSRMNEIIRSMARDYADRGVTLVDAEAELARQSSSGISGKEWFYEHVHLNFDGSYRLGLLWADAIARKLPAWVRQGAHLEWASQDLIERRLGLSDWNRGFSTHLMMPRLQQPPLSFQPNNPERLQAILDYEQELLLRMTPSNAVAARAMHTEEIGHRADDHFLLMTFGRFLAFEKELDAATEMYRQANRLLPHDYFSTYQLGRLLSQQQQFDEAASFMQRATETHPARAEPWRELGLIYISQGRFEEALGAFQKAAGLQPPSPYLLAFEGRAFHELERYSEAGDRFQRAIELKHDYWEAHVALGDSLFKLRSLDEAALSYENTIKLNPDHVAAHFKLGLVYGELGRFPEAAGKFEDTLARDPNHHEARQYLNHVRNRVELGH